MPQDLGNLCEQEDRDAAIGRAFDAADMMTQIPEGTGRDELVVAIQRLEYAVCEAAEDVCHAIDRLANRLTDHHEDDLYDVDEQRESHD